MQISGTALVLDEIINHVQSLQRQVEVRVAHPIHLKITNINISMWKFKLEKTLLEKFCG